jgi:hypothetical protein
MMGPFLDSGDGNTVEGGLTITQPDIRLSKNGGAFAQKSAAQTLVHGENGWYPVNLSTTDTNTCGILQVVIHESGGLQVWSDFTVVEEAIYDAFYAAGATGLLPSNVTQFNGVAATSASGRPEVNASHIAGSAVSTASAQIGVNVINAAGTAWNSGAIGAATLASDTITNAKIAADAIGASEIADGAIDAATFAAGAINAAAIAADAIGASELASDAATEIGTAVWATAARTLTALDEDNTTLDLDATIQAAVGLASANLDTQIGDLPTNAELATSQAAADDATLAAIAALNNLSAAQVNTEVDTALADYDGPTHAELVSEINTVQADIAALNNITADNVWDEAVEGSTTAREMMRLYASALSGKSSGLETTTAVYRDLADSKNRISATVDTDGNRSAVTRDLT